MGKGEVEKGKRERKVKNSTWYLFPQPGAAHELGLWRGTTVNKG